jgi:hypothetical protein
MSKPRTDAARRAVLERLAAVRARDALQQRLDEARFDLRNAMVANDRARMGELDAVCRQLMRELDSAADRFVAAYVAERDAKREGTAP